MERPPVLTPKLRAEMRAAAEAATPGIWRSDQFETEDGFGRYFAYQVFDAREQELLGTENCHYLAAEIHDDRDGEGGSRWDEAARKNTAHVAAWSPANALAVDAALTAAEAERAEHWRRRRDAEGSRDVAKAAMAKWRERAEAAEAKNAALSRRLADVEHKNHGALVTVREITRQRDEALTANALLKPFVGHGCIPKPGEPFFVLLGRDAQAPAVVEQWARSRLAARPDDVVKVSGAHDTAVNMRAYRAACRVAE